MSSYYNDHNVPSQEQSRRREERRRAVAEHFTHFFSTGQPELDSNAQGTESPLIQVLLSQLRDEMEQAEKPLSGVSERYLDTLERVSKSKLAKRPDDSCAICACRFLDDEYPLVVELPCSGKHRYDLECVGPWLKMNSTCPLCRTDLQAKKVVEKEDDDEEEEYNDMYS